MYIFGSIRMTHAAVARVVAACAYATRKRCLMLLFAGLFSVAVLSTVSSRFPREDQMEQRLAAMHAHLQFLDSLYRARQEDVLDLQTRMLTGMGNETPNHIARLYDPSTTMSPEVLSLLRNITGSRAAAGIDPRNLQLIKTPFVYQLLPHLMTDPLSLRPAYHMRGKPRPFADVVMGIPTVRRDKESYLMITLAHLVNNLVESEHNSTLIIVFIGETDLEYVLNTARQIEAMFPKHVKSGLIEVLSPSPSYYPDLEALHPTLGDSAKRFKWRTKQNLDTMYLMAYAQTRGTYYLMLEDDVIAKKRYMQDIKEFTAQTSINNPQWFFIEYCTVGGIGKLFRSSDLLHFITYVQLFYNNLPIDWLLESYLADRVCTIEKNSKQCVKSKLQIRPRYKTSLFLHIGLYSSLKGKMQKVNDPHFGPVPTFYPHANPPLQAIKTDIEEHGDHTLRRAYEGKSYFWGIKPRKGDVLEFWFEKPTTLERYTFRSGNVEHVSDKFYDTLVEVLPARGSSNFTQVGAFDEFGLADDLVRKDLGPLSAIRLKVMKDSSYWVILSEIELRPYEEGSR